jgi:hypothetical protein
MVHLHVSPRQLARASGCLFATGGRLLLRGGMYACWAIKMCWLEGLSFVDVCTLGSFEVRRLSTVMIDHYCTASRVAASGDSRGLRVMGRCWSFAFE